jgi:hypothetical protein
MSDRELSKTAKDSNSKAFTGQVDGEYSVGGNSLQLDTLELVFYIKVKDVASTGDKVVFSNQLKAVIGEVYNYSVRTESGNSIEAIFGEKSINARIVTSPLIIGTTTTLLKLLAKRAVELYKK